MAIMNVTEKEFDATIASGTVVVDFGATWCGPCQMQAKLLDAKFAPAHPDVTIAKVDIDQNMTLAAKFGIQSIPALRVFKDGHLVASFDGLTKPDELATVL